MNHNPPLVGNGGYYGAPPQGYPQVASYNQMHMAPPPPFVSGATPIIINQGTNQRGCPFCKSTSGVVDTQVMGCAILGWSVALCLITGCCCWIPFVISDCFDR